MKKIIILLTVFLIACSGMYAVDVGGTLVASASVTTDNPTQFSITPSFVFTGWLRQPVGKIGSFAAEGTLQSAMENPVLDLSLFKLTMNAGPVKAELGRFAVADATGIIYSMTADGAFLTLGTRYVTLNAYGAYTGFQNSLNMSVNGIAQTVEPSNPFYDIRVTPKFAVGLGRVMLPSLLKGQTFTVDALAALDMEKKEPSRYYGMVSANGPVANMVYYGLTGAGSYIEETGGTDGGSAIDASMGYLAKGNIVWYPGSISSSLSFSVTYASDGFTTFSVGGPSQDGSRQWQNVLDVQIGVSAKPISIALVSFTGDLIASQSAVGFYLDSIQWKGSSTVQIVSDISMSVAIGEIVPISQTTNAFLSGSFSATLAF